MSFKPGDEVIYSYNGFVYRIELISREVKHEVFWKAYFLMSVGKMYSSYGYREVQKFPEEFMRKLTKLERALK